MKLLNLGARNFRSLLDISWTPGDLNVLIGPNGSGKTNLVLLLKLIAQSARGKLGDFVLKQGGITPLLWDRKAGEFSFALGTTSDEPSRSVVPHGSNYSVRIASKGGEGFYQIQEERLRSNSGSRKTGKRVERMDFLAQGARSGQVLDDKGDWIRLDLDALSAEESLLAACTGPFSRRTNFAAPYQKYLAGWSIYDSLPVDPGAKIREPVVARYATHVDENQRLHRRLEAA